MLAPAADTALPDQVWQRCFLGLIPDAATCAALAQQALPPGLIPVAPTDLHLTLAFLGAITPSQGRALIQALPTLACALPPLPSLAAQHWPDAQHPTVTVQCYALLPGLQAIHALTQTLLQTLALPIEARTYRPHITLGRWPHPPAGPIAMAGPAGAAQFAAVALYTSGGAPPPAHYRILAQHPLRRMPAKSNV